MGNVEDKVLIITGGTFGIGEGCVKEIAKAGAKVVFCGRTVEKGKALEKEMSRQNYAVKYVRADVTIAEDNKRLIDETITAFKRVDGIMCNAGGGNSKLHFMHQYTPEEWYYLVNLNFNAAFFLSKYAIPHMMKQQGGSIIFIGSATTAKPQLYQSHYGPPKAGMYQLSRQISLEYCRYGIRANMISPGATWTQIFEKSGISDEQAAATSPAKKIAYPNDIANVAMFLFSDDAKTVTGTNIFADYAYGCGNRYDQMTGFESRENAKNILDEC
jgi:NAD(P)-dependent dehydrogenase (short-subunit alcohol dehydrogenase family)